jgi:hypothetical protein
MSKPKPPSPPLNRAAGYCRPPADKQFKPGQSGNPKGRPAKKRAAARSAATLNQINDLVLAEALRPVQITENGKTIEIPTAQAVLRSQGIAAMKGNVRAQGQFTKTVQDAQAQQDMIVLETLIEAYRYKQEKQAILDQCKHQRIMPPRMVPHPGDIVIDLRTGTVRFNGPVTLEDAALWEAHTASRALAIEAFESNPAEPGSAARDRYLEAVLSELPDEETRRKPGFDITEWHKKQARALKLVKTWR